MSNMDNFKVDLILLLVELYYYKFSNPLKILIDYFNRCMYYCGSSKGKYQDFFIIEHSLFQKVMTFFKKYFVYIISSHYRTTFF